MDIEIEAGGDAGLMDRTLALLRICDADPQMKHVVVNTAINLVGWAEAANPGPSLDAFTAAVRRVAAVQDVRGTA